MKITQELFGRTPAGEEVNRYTLVNAEGMVVQIINLGGIITALKVADKHGGIDDVVLGFDSLSPYLERHPNFGVIAGRYANRIARGRFTLDGVEYRLSLNAGRNHLHGGTRHFGHVVWRAEQDMGPDWVGLKLSYLSVDGEEGYPGNLRAAARYRLNDRNELSVEYEAVTDKPTIVNLTNHSYFNLSGEGSGNVLAHEIMIDADGYTAVDQDLIPTGEIVPVRGTALDFTVSRAIGARISELDIGGYDHNYVLNNKDGRLAPAAKVYDPRSGRVLQVLTTKPGLQFYTGNNLAGDFKGKSGRPYGKHSGFCLETQYFPDAPNHSSFPSARLDPGEIYRHKTIFRFSVC